MVLFEYVFEELPALWHMCCGSPASFSKPTGSPIQHEVRSTAQWSPVLNASRSQLPWASPCHLLHSDALQRCQLSESDQRFVRCQPLEASPGSGAPSLRVSSPLLCCCIIIPSVARLGSRQESVLTKVGTKTPDQAPEGPSLHFLSSSTFPFVHWDVLGCAMCPYGGHGAPGVAGEETLLSADRRA